MSLQSAEIAKNIVDFTTELVSIPTFESEDKVVRTILNKFSQLNINGGLVGVDQNHPSVIGLVKNPNPRKTIFLNAPLDTTPPGDLDKWDHNPFEAHLIGNKLYGLGVADAKVAIAMYTYLAYAFEQDPDFNDSIFLGFDAQEQNGKFIGIREIIPFLPSIDAAFLGYQSYDEIHIGARGWLRLKLQIFGKSYHTGSAKKKGVNAIHRLITAINKIQQLEIDQPSPYFEYGSNINISVISGGVAINVVPDHAECLIDIRLTPPQNPQTIVAQIQNALTEIQNEDTLFSYSLDTLQAERGYLTHPDHPLVKLLHNNSNKNPNLNTGTILTTSGPGGVGNILSQLDMPIINAYGVDCGGVHSNQEWLDITTIQPVFETLYKTIKEYCSDHS